MASNEPNQKKATTLGEGEKGRKGKAKGNRHNTGNYGGDLKKHESREGQVKRENPPRREKIKKTPISQRQTGNTK